MLSIKDLTKKQLIKLKSYSLDNLEENRHEYFNSFITGSDFLLIKNRPVLLPVPKKNHLNIKTIKIIISDNDHNAIIYLSDKTYYPQAARKMDTGYLAICERVTDEAYYITTFYHNWYYID